MTSGYYRTSSPVTALPMIRRWISDVPSKIVKIVDRRPVCAGRWRGAGAEPAPSQRDLRRRQSGDAPARSGRLCIRWATAIEEGLDLSSMSGILGQGGVRHARPSSPRRQHGRLVVVVELPLDGRTASGEVPHLRGDHGALAETKACPVSSWAGVAAPVRRRYAWQASALLPLAK
jgi:hypothetical protein